MFQFSLEIRVVVSLEKVQKRNFVAVCNCVGKQDIWQLFASPIRWNLLPKQVSSQSSFHNVKSNIITSINVLWSPILFPLILCAPQSSFFVFLSCVRMYQINQLAANLSPPPKSKLYLIDLSNTWSKSKPETVFSLFSFSVSIFVPSSSYFHQTHVQRMIDRINEWWVVVTFLVEEPL